jgi:hypothetical protein
VKFGKYVLITGANDKGLSWDKNHPNNQAAYDAMYGKLTDYFAKKGATITIHVRGVDGVLEYMEFTKWTDLWYYARKGFLGKGSVEEVQITLQLAARFNLLAGGDMQSYCDKYLGLDCNGFVGNHLVHGLRGDDWDAEPPGTDFLANKTIDVIMKAKGSTIKTVDDLVPASSYVMGLVGPSGNVIPQYEGSAIGHVFITQPGLKWESVYTDAKGKDKKVWTMYAAESTGGVGLAFEKCQFVSVSKDGIFQVKRFSHPLDAPLPFRASRAA